MEWESLSKIPSIDQRCLSGWSSSSEEISWFGFGISRRRGNQNNNKKGRRFWFWLWKFVSSCKFGRVENLDFRFGSSSTIKTKKSPVRQVVSGRVVGCLTFTSGRRQQSKQQQRLKKRLSATTICFRLCQLSRLFWFWTLTTTTTKPLAIVPIHARKLELFGLWWGVTGWKLPASSEEAIVIEQFGQMWLVWLWIQDWWTFVVIWKSTSLDSMEQDAMPDEINEVIKDEYLRVEFLGEKLAEGELSPDRLVGVE
jgi:hypothetical protein